MKKIILALFLAACSKEAQSVSKVIAETKKEQKKPNVTLDSLCKTELPGELDIPKEIVAKGTDKVICFDREGYLLYSLEVIQHLLYIQSINLQCIDHTLDKL